MKDQNKRRFIKKLRAACAAEQIEVAVDPSAGKGDHFGLSFTDKKTGENLRLILDAKNSKEIGCNVLRKTYRFLLIKATSIAIAKVIAIIWENLTNG